MPEGGSGSQPKRPAAGAGLGWAWKMAWRDSRGQRGVLLLFVLCIVFGIAALVAINSLRANLEATVQNESRALVGADLRIETRSPFTEELDAWLEALDGDISRELVFRSMARFPRIEQNRFVQVRALQTGFPFYGRLDTIPEAVDFRDPAAPRRALVEAGLLHQYGLEPGDILVLGEAEFVIAAALERVAGESELGGFFAPRVFIAFDDAAATGLIQEGSVGAYRAYLRFEGGLTAERREALNEARNGLFVDAGVRYETVEYRQASLGRVMGNLFSFLSLVGFIALFLGGIGVGGAVQVYLQPKLASVATLRCLGAPAASAFAIYLWQITVVGLGGALLGTGIGVGAQMLLPVLLGPFLPFAVELSVHGPSIFFGLVFGWLVAMLFALRPLLGVRRISPLRALRADYESVGVRRDPWRRFVTFLLMALGLGYSIWQAPQWWQGLAFALGLGAAYGILLLSALALRGLLRRLRSSRWPYAVRLALSNLYRPNNRTVFLVTTLGLGAFLISTLHLSRTALLDRIDGGGDSEDRPNIILIDVQPDQVEAISGRLSEIGHPPVEVLPVVTMRPRTIAGRTLREWRNDPESPIRNWVYTWEFRATYRDYLLPNESVVAGEFIPFFEGDEPIPISLSDGILESFGLEVGGEIEWDVQGLPIRTVVASSRAIDWELGRQNFGVLWPTGVLEAAPVMHAIGIRVENRGETIAVQRAIGMDFPNVSILDLSLIFETIDSVLRRVSFVVQFMAGFTVFTGLIVLFGAMVTSRYQRVRESVFLRTLGAGSGFVRSLLSWEYALLGLLAASIGVGLSVAATAAVTRWIFQVPFSFELLPLLLIFGAVVLLTLLTGWINSRGIASAPPLQVLREEG